MSKEAKEYTQESLFQAPTKSANVAKNDFRKLFEQLSWNQAYYTTFDDFLDFALFQLDVQPEKDMEIFNRLESRYAPKLGKIFAQMFQDWIVASDNEGEGMYDVLGDLYMELLSKSRAGQFFTPQCVCDMMGQMTWGNHIDDGQTVSDPAGVGSGRMLLAAAKVNRNARFFGQDTDLTCCKMTVLNMVVNTMEGEIAWMDSLRMKHYKSWIIRKRKIQGKWLPCFITLPEGISGFLHTAKHYPYGSELEEEKKLEPPPQIVKMLKDVMDLFTDIPKPSKNGHFYSVEDQYRAYMRQME